MSAQGRRAQSRHRWRVLKGKAGIQFRQQRTGCSGRQWSRREFNQPCAHRSPRSPSNRYASLTVPSHPWNSPSSAPSLACGFSFLTLLAALCIVRWRGAGVSRGASFLTLGIGLFAALLTTVVFLIDVIFVAIAKHQINHDTDGVVSGTWGNAVRVSLSPNPSLAVLTFSHTGLDGPWGHRGVVGRSGRRLRRLVQSQAQVKVRAKTGCPRPRDS